MWLVTQWTLQYRWMRTQEVKKLTQEPAADKWQQQDLNPGLSETQFFVCLFVCFAVLEVELGALHFLGRSSSTWAMPATLLV
jgi:hypothetical protein